jgi:hypothetical protein
MEHSNTTSRYSRLVQELPVIVLFFCLAASPSIVRHYFGRGWGVIAAGVVLAAWLVIRPWRFKRLPQDSRRGIFIIGTVMLAMLVLVHSFFFLFIQTVAMLPNKSPEPTAVGACSSAVAVHATSRRWLSFFR